MARLFEFARKPKPPARKTPTGTTYQSKGLNAAKPPKTDSEAGSSAPVVVREVVPQLISPFLRQQEYAKMMNDAAVDVSVRAAKTPILGAEYFVDPFSDDPLDVEVAEFIWANLGEGMSAPFLNSLEDILHFYEDGYSVLEKVYEMREWAPRKTRSSANTKNFIMLKKLGARPASTIKELQYDDNGGPKAIVQNAIKSDRSVNEVTLPIDKALIFTHNRTGGDLMGKSLLRTAYPHWYYKTHFYKIDAIQKERFSLGVLKGKLMPGFAPSDKAILRTMLRNYRTNEESFMLLTPNVDVEVQFPGGTPVDVLSSAVHHNQMILMNVLGQFIALGTEGGGGGGRATAATQSDLFMKSLKYVANLIAQEINMYLIPELVVWNYPTKNFPRLQVRNLGETRDLQMLGAALSNLFSQQGLTPDLDTENWIRKVFDMPAKAESAIETAKPEPVVAATNEPVATSTSANGKGNKGSLHGEKTGGVGKPINAPQ